jgi:thiol-disulfide isomerase/thioredoxin
LNPEFPILYLKRDYMKSAVPFLLLLSISLWSAEPTARLWDAAVTVNNVEIPFRMEIQAKPQATAAFFNGDLRIPSASGQFSDNVLTLRFDLYATKLEAKWDGTAFTGTYSKAGRAPYGFKAKPFVPVETSDSQVPSISGLWDIPVKSGKGEKAWRFIVRQSGPAVTATILRVDGDTGELSGRFHDGKFTLSHFSGARPTVLEVTAKPDGTLEVIQNKTSTYLAIRSTEARKQGLPEPTDPSRHTSVKDPSEPFQFQGVDLAGKLVNEADPRFAGKVVIVSIGGSWCPNCHDEAPFLVELDRDYRSKGLQIVNISFEEAEQLKDPFRLRAFIKQYGIQYTVLLGGEQEQVRERLPQAVNLNTWPATFFLGRDGRVRSVHAGFASPATGEEHTRLKAEVRHTVEKLLAETNSASATSLQ